MVLKTELCRFSVVPRSTLARVSDLSVQIRRCSFFQIRSASATSTTASSQPSSHGQPCTGSSTRRTFMRAEAVKKRHCTTKKPYSRSSVGATLEVIQKKRTEKPEVRDAARKAALRYASFL